MKRFLFITGVLVVWLFIQVFANDYVATKINHSNQLKRQAIKQGAHQFLVEQMTINHVVSSFRKDWVDSKAGVVSVKPNPEVSVELNGFLIVPRLHQSVVIDAAVESDSNSATFGIELSNQQEQIYYHSGALSVQQLGQPLDLTDITWQVIASQDGAAVENEQAWQKLHSFDALVVRFYDTEMVHLKHISIRQYEPQIIDDGLFKTCEVTQLSCFNNNQKNHTENKWNYAEGVSLVNYEKISGLPPMSWLLFSGVLMCLLLVLIQAGSIKVIGLVLFAFGSIGILHQTELAAYLDWIKWILAPIILLLLWLYKSAFLKPQRLALSVYVISLGLAFLMVFFSLQIPDFVADLPSYFIWALIQQLILGPVLSDYLKKQSTAADGEIALMVGVMFSVVHAPNHSLMIATLLGGVLWSYSWLKYKNIYANAFSHAILALVFYAMMPSQWLGSARIGVFF